MVIPELAMVAVVILATGAEFFHFARVRRLSALAFGPPSDARVAAINPWIYAGPMLRIAALAALTWGLMTLLLITPKVHKATQVLKDSEYKHILLVLDVSPSMRLKDAGKESDQSRMERARDLMESIFQRVSIERYRVTVVAVYNEAKPVVIDTKDLDVVKNILGDLPMHYAFVAGETDLFSGLKAAAEIAAPWAPKSTTLILLSDGDTVPSTGMPKMPVSVSGALVLGVGDPRKGTFINGRQSRQDTSTLRQLAVRLRGTYHNGNQKHLPSVVLRELADTPGTSPLENLTRREIALFLCCVGAFTLALLPVFLHYFATRWRPGVSAGATRDGRMFRSFAADADVARASAAKLARK